MKKKLQFKKKEKKKIMMNYTKNMGGKKMEKENQPSLQELQKKKEAVGSPTTSEFVAKQTTVEKLPEITKSPDDIKPLPKGAPLKERQANWRARHKVKKKYDMEKHKQEMAFLSNFLDMSMSSAFNLLMLKKVGEELTAQEVGETKFGYNTIRLIEHYFPEFDLNHPAIALALSVGALTTMVTVKYYRGAKKNGINSKEKNKGNVKPVDSGKPNGTSSGDRKPAGGSAYLGV